jgi:hypothetical protein
MPYRSGAGTKMEDSQIAAPAKFPAATRPAKARTFAAYREART